MSVWREVQEAIYQRWETAWAGATPFAFGNERFDPPGEGPWVRLRVVSRPGGPETLGTPGKRKMNRRGAVFAILQEPPGNGVRTLSDLAENAKLIFACQRLPVHDIRFETGDISGESEIEQGRWWGVTAEVPFAYEELI